MVINILREFRSSTSAAQPRVDIALNLHRLLMASNCSICKNLNGINYRNDCTSSNLKAEITLNAAFSSYSNGNAVALTNILEPYFIPEDGKELLWFCYWNIKLFCLIMQQKQLQNWNIYSKTCWFVSNRQKCADINLHNKQGIPLCCPTWLEGSTNCCQGKVMLVIYEAGICEADWKIFSTWFVPVQISVGFF